MPATVTVLVLVLVLEPVTRNPLPPLTHGTFPLTGDNERDLVPGEGRALRSRGLFPGHLPHPHRGPLGRQGGPIPHSGAAHPECAQVCVCVCVCECVVSLTAVFNLD